MESDEAEAACDSDRCDAGIAERAILNTASCITPRLNPPVDLNCPSVDTALVSRYVTEVGNLDCVVPVDESPSDDVEEEQVFSEDINYRTPDGKRHRLVKQCAGVVDAPCVGMTFETIDAVESYFRSYGKQQGFGTVKAASVDVVVKGVKTGEKRSLTLRCDRWGSKDTRRRVNGKKVKLHCLGQSGVKVAVRASKKCFCPVMLRCSRDKHGNWVIRSVILEHVGHSPVPSEARYVSRYRQDAITPNCKKRVLVDKAAGIGFNLSYRALAIEKDGVDNLGFTERDLRNFVAKERKIKMDMEGGDAAALVNFFKKMHELNSNFYHSERVDRHDRLKDIMWVDARSREAYLEFSDVVCFDSTYITNQFKLPFAIFVGVNHHGQTILFGCALLSHEDSESFEWLFSCWLNAMNGIHPKAILTDQCAAMRKALATVMPDTRHRWCLWHIMKKFREKLGAYTKYQEFKKHLKAAIYESLDPEEFEERWSAVIRQYKLEDNDWLQGLFEEREMWVPAYMRHIFWAGMKTTQRSESINSFFDGYVHKNTALHEFGSQYFSAMSFRARAEEDADAHSLINVRELVSEFPIEVEFQKRYTSDKFYEFQVECLKLMYVSQVSRSKLSEHVYQHVVEDVVWVRCKRTRRDVPTQKVREYRVTYDSSTGDAFCVCQHFETYGIMCRHLIRVFASHQVQKLNQKFILRRWCKDVDRRHMKVKVNYSLGLKTDESKREDAALKEFNVLLPFAGKSEKNLEYVLKVIKEAVMMLQKEELADKPNIVTASGTSKKRSNVDVTPVSVKKSTPATQESIGEIGTPAFESSPFTTVNCTNTTTDGNSRDDASVLKESIIKDPPLPKNPKHRTTDSRYKSTAELKTTGGKGKAKGKGKPIGKEQKIEELIEKYLVSHFPSAFQQHCLQPFPDHVNPHCGPSNLVQHPFQSNDAVRGNGLNPHLITSESARGQIRTSLIKGDGTTLCNGSNGEIPCAVKKNLFKGPTTDTYKSIGAIAMTPNGPFDSRPRVVRGLCFADTGESGVDLGLGLGRIPNADPREGLSESGVDLRHIHYFTGPM